MLWPIPDIWNDIINKDTLVIDPLFTFPHTLSCFQYQNYVKKYVLVWKAKKCKESCKYLLDMAQSKSDKCETPFEGPTLENDATVVVIKLCVWFRKSLHTKDNTAKIYFHANDSLWA